MKRNTAELKEKLIATGVEEIRTRGVNQLSIRTVAQRCGVTHGAPYKHFENKDVYLQDPKDRRHTTPSARPRNSRCRLH